MTHQAGFQQEVHMDQVQSLSTRPSFIDPRKERVLVAVWPLPPGEGYSPASSSAISKESFCTEVLKSRIFSQSLTCHTSLHTCEFDDRYARSNFYALSACLMSRPAYLLSTAFVNITLKTNTHENNKNYA